MCAEKLIISSNNVLGWLLKVTGLILTLEAGKKIMNHDVEAAKTYWDKAILVSRTALNSVRELVSEKGESYFEF